MTALSNKITESEFEALLATADDTRTTDYSMLQANPGPRVVAAMRGGKVFAMGYYGQGPAGEPGSHFYA